MNRSGILIVEQQKPCRGSCESLDHYNDIGITADNVKQATMAQKKHLPYC
jgi:hypothetical protein